MRISRVLVCCAVVTIWAASAVAGPPPGNPTLFADFNGDGKVDIVREGLNNIQADHLDGTVSVGSGSFKNGGGALTMRAVGNVDINDFADLAVQGAGTIRVDLTNSTGTGAASSIFIGDGGGTWQVRDLCDVNGDGKDEVISEGNGAIRMTDLSSGAQVNSYISTAGGIWEFLYCLDANGDGDDDLYFNGVLSAAGTSRTNLSGIGAQVFYGQGGGVWVPTLSADTNGDGIDDLVDTGTAAAAGSLRVTILDGSGTGLSPKGFVADGGGSFLLMTAADHNADGREDLGLSGETTNKITLMAADGLAAQSSFFPSNGGGTTSLDIAADTDGDGIADLVSVFANEDVSLQTIVSEAVSGTGVLPAGGRVLFVP
jgi:hypothetical protein